MDYLNNKTAKSEQNNNKSTQKHIVTLEDRSKLTITAVNEVVSAQPNAVVIKTSEGALSVNGDNLHIEKLVLEEGLLELSGNVSLLKYNSNIGKSFFKRLFK